MKNLSPFISANLKLGARTPDQRTTLNLKLET